MNDDTDDDPRRGRGQRRCPTRNASFATSVAASGRTSAEATVGRS